MKKISKLMLLASLLLTGLWSCEKEENKVYFQGGTAPVLTASRSTTIPLTFATQGQEALTLRWTNPTYMFNTGISSQDVSYLIEIDTVGANFTNPQRQTVSVSKDLSRTFTQTELNDYLLNQLLLVPGMSHNIEMRVRASLANNAVPMYSNVVSFTTTPYAIPPKVEPPSTGKLFITGSATPAGWQCGCGEAELTSQMFTQMSPTMYVLPRIRLNGGGSYLLLPKYGDWGAKYGFVGSNNANNPEGDDFKFNGGDLIAPAATGDYRIEVDFQRGKFTVTKL